MKLYGAAFLATLLPLALAAPTPEFQTPQGRTNDCGATYDTVKELSDGSLDTEDCKDLIDEITADKTYRLDSSIHTIEKYGTCAIAVAKTDSDTENIDGGSVNLPTYWSNMLLITSRVVRGSGARA
ncbi:hypothetical protein NUU61_004185 [Penicillium alfredii]|uniref:Ecp2 effector protein-like domain-containing protein n=1 Tax=Penicillium alfredii TaxID=1506179 RepID=A0A9W9FKN0_9EURO|nr:uncharacterized protein NUU61_004185 [Penicillium alfredii]KAJ5101963.1 hypothetical protein NUU61_004185 [Penicillium alfredii]